MNSVINKQPYGETETETIALEHNNPEAWICICRNTPIDDGFYPVNASNPENNNREVEPTPDDWSTDEYVCRRCGRVISMESLRVTRRVELGTFVWLP